MAPEVVVSVTVGKTAAAAVGTTFKTTTSVVAIESAPIEVVV